jgi:hypothetical protein
LISGLSNLVSSPVGQFMRTRNLLLLTLASVALSMAPSLAGAQRVIAGDCGDRYSSRYVDCRIEVERSRAAQREAIRERAEQQRERNRWDGIVRKARAEARSYDLAERSRQRAAERVTRERVARETREVRVRDRIDGALRERNYRIRR